MRSATPKLLHPLCGRPLIDWPVVAARNAGARRIVVVDSPQRRLTELLAGQDDVETAEHELHVREVNTGIFAFDGGELLDALGQVRADNAQGEYYLPDVLPVLRAAERTVVAYELEDVEESLGINDRVALAEVRGLAQARIHRTLMRAGVTIVDPAATVIDAGVEIGPDTVVEPFSSLHGTTRIGAGVLIGSHSTLTDTTVADGARVIHAYAMGSEIGERVSVVPFAYLRP